jgi:hypothetical protein
MTEDMVRYFEFARQASDDGLFTAILNARNEGVRDRTIRTWITRAGDDLLDHWSAAVDDRRTELHATPSSRGCEHPEFSDGRCAEMSCHNYYGKFMLTHHN